MFQIEKRDNKAYIINSDFDYFKPNIITNFWKINNIDPDLLNDRQYLEHFNGIFITKIHDKITPLYINELPDFTEFIPVKPPRKTGYKWYEGEWRKV